MNASVPARTRALRARIVATPRVDSGTATDVTSPVPMSSSSARAIRRSVMESSAMPESSAEGRRLSTVDLESRAAHRKDGENRRLLDPEAMSRRVEARVVVRRAFVLAERVHRVHAPDALCTAAALAGRRRGVGVRADLLAREEVVGVDPER